MCLVILLVCSPMFVRLFIRSVDWLGWSFHSFVECPFQNPKCTHQACSTVRKRLARMKHEKEMEEARPSTTFWICVESVCVNAAVAIATVLLVLLLLPLLRPLKSVWKSVDRDSLNDIVDGNI